jgi:hypothetical protein
MQLKITIFLLFLSVHIQAQDKAQNALKSKIKHPALQAELLERKKTDQLYRNIMSPNTPPKTLDSLNILQHKMDKANTDWLKIQIKKHGWLGIKEVGKEGDNAAWLLVQHADKDTTFQINVLKILVKQVKINNTDKMNFAYLTDRILVNTGKKQLFATQIKETIKDSTGKVTNLIFQPLQNESQTDSLRAEVGLPTQAEYKADFMKHLNRKMKE